MLINPPNAHYQMYSDGNKERLSSFCLVCLRETSDGSVQRMRRIDVVPLKVSLR